MATDYDAPRKTDDSENESIEALKERVPAKSVATDDDADNPNRVRPVHAAAAARDHESLSRDARRGNSPAADSGSRGPARPWSPRVSPS